MKPISNKSLSKLIRISLFLTLLVAANPALSSAQALERAGFGPNPAAIQPVVDAFRNGLGQLNPNNGQSFVSGRREVNWDDVPDPVLSELGFMPPTYYNTNIPAGIVLDSTGGRKPLDRAEPG